jgi:hypothetical protein
MLLSEARCVVLSCGEGAMDIVRIYGILKLDRSGGAPCGTGVTPHSPT